MKTNKSTQNDRRSFLKQSAALAGASMLPGLLFSNGCAKAIGTDSALSEDTTGGALTNTLTSITVIDSQVWYVNNTHNGTYASIPADPDFRLFSGYPVIPAVNPVPFPWGTENFYSGKSGCITDNVYLEPGQPWVVQLAISTPGAGDTSTGSPQYKTWYRISTNGGVTFSPLKQVIINGHTSMNPIEGVEIGRNGFNVDFTRPIVQSSNGKIMVPVGLHPWDDVNEEIYLPVPGAYLFQDAGVLVGTWLPDGSDITWDFGGWLRIDHNLSTRGLSEPTIVETNTPGRFAMVCRGSNLANLSLPCHAWVSFSNDYCQTWSAPQPFKYSNGNSFYVTTAQSALFKSRTNGKTYWIGNLNTVNPAASHPRYPLVIGEVDLDNFGLIEDSVVEIDNFQTGKDQTTVQLSNFKILEHKVDEEIIVYFTRREGSTSASKASWFRIQLA